MRPAGTAGRRRGGRRAGTGCRRGRAGPCRRGRARSRCRAAMRRLPADRHQRRAQVTGCAPARRHPGRVPSGGGGIAGGVSRASCSVREASVFMRPRLDSCGGTSTDMACRLKTSWLASGPSSGRGSGRVPRVLKGDDRADLATAIDGMRRARNLAGQRRYVIMKVCRGGRPAGGRRVMRFSSACRAAAGGVPGERSARTSSAASPVPRIRRSPRRRSRPSSAGALTT